MPLVDIQNRSSILSAFNEFDAIGREAFLKIYGFQKSRKYFLFHDGHLYDSKPIVAATHGFEFPELGPLTSTEFSGGGDTLRRMLRGLGFSLETWPSANAESNAHQLERAAQNVQETVPFDPIGIEDGRNRIFRQIAQRQGQTGFRNSLLDAYQGRCAITNCNVAETLEAAHIYPYRGVTTNHVTNGLLLRADIHTLFDLGMIAIDTRDFSVVVAGALCGTSYAELEGTQLTLPMQDASRPSERALEWHRERSALS